MARIKYTLGIECQCCGNIVYDYSFWTVICQKCGTQLLTTRSSNDANLVVTSNAKVVTVKVTRKFFSKTYEKARDY